MPTETIEKRGDPIVQKTTSGMNDMAKAASDNARPALDQAREAATQMGAVLEDTARRVGATANDYGQEAYSRGQQAASLIERRVNDQPWAALAVAAASATDWPICFTVADGTALMPVARPAQPETNRRPPDGRIEVAQGLTITAR